MKSRTPLMSASMPGRVEHGKPREPPSRSDFTFGRLLGEGAYATVVHVKMKRDPSREFALKIMNKHRIMRENKIKYVMLEREILAKLSSAWVIKIALSFIDSQNLYICMEYAGGGSLLRLIDKYTTSNKQSGVLNLSLPPSMVLFYTSEIVEALEYIHLSGVVHRDLKPENIVLTSEGHVKLCDFGSAVLIEGSRMAPTSTAPSTGVIMTVLDGEYHRNNGGTTTNTSSSSSSHGGTTRHRRPALDPSDILVTSTTMKNGEEKQGGVMRGGGPSSSDTHSQLRMYQREDKEQSPTPSQHQNEEEKDQQQQQEQNTSQNGSFVGSSEYVSPEILRNQPASTGSDMWALGCIIFKLYTGRSPFLDDGSEYLTFQNIMSHADGRSELVYPETIPWGPSRDVIDALLQGPPRERLGANSSCNDAVAIPSDQTADNVIGLAQNGFLALKHHTYFTGVPWGELLDTGAPCKPTYEEEDDEEFSRAFGYDIGNEFSKTDSIQPHHQQPHQPSHYQQLLQQQLSQDPNHNHEEYIRYEYLCNVAEVVASGQERQARIAKRKQKRLQQQSLLSQEEEDGEGRDGDRDGRNGDGEMEEGVSSSSSSSSSSVGGGSKATSGSSSHT